MKLAMHLKIFFILFLAVGTDVYSQTWKQQTAAIRAGDVIRSKFSDSVKINLYQGNGRFGSSYGALGLHNAPGDVKNTDRYGKTEYLHMGHWVRAKFNADYLLPLLKVYWKNKATDISNYQQQQSFYDGQIKTSFKTEKGSVNVETWFDAVERDISVISINLNGKSDEVVINPLQNLVVHYGQKLVQDIKIIPQPGYFEILYSCMGKKSSLFVYSQSQIKIVDQKLQVELHEGENSLLFSYGKPTSSTALKSRARTIAWWKEKWMTTTSLILPDQDAQKIWVRSMAIILSTVNDDRLGFPAPMGLTSNGWPFAFPQDLSYIHSLLLTTGHLAIAKSWVEQYASRIKGMTAYTKRLYNVDGIFLPWVFPYGSFKGYHEPAPPNIFNFEIHNSGYLCRMASETAKYVDDPAWTKANVVELIKGTALFYKSIAKKGSDSLWHLSVKPSMGQDEMGGANQDDYLCALYSAKYCFQQAIAFNLDDDGVYRSILKDGLAFPKLLSKKGIYFTSSAGKDEDFGKQKHPVQLNELAYLPVDTALSKPALAAYRKRYEITLDANKPYFYGWTLGEFLLSGSRTGLVEEWKKDWDNIKKSGYADVELIQFYETSKATGASFYTTTHALVAQSLISNLIDDWHNKLEIGKCNPWIGKVYLQRVYSVLGIYCNGTIDQKKAKLELTAWKDCRFNLQGKQVTLKKGERIKMVCQLP